MNRIAVLASLVLAACNARPPVERPCATDLPCTPSPDPAPAPAPGSGSTAQAKPVDCGVARGTLSALAPNLRAVEQCLVDAFRAGAPASAMFSGISDEGGKTITTYHLVSGPAGLELDLDIDDRDDGYAAAPGLHHQRCTATRIEPGPQGGEQLVPDGCH
jgi:hypothetical protein